MTSPRTICMDVTEVRGQTLTHGTETASQPSYPPRTMIRRDFIGLLGSLLTAPVAWPRSAAAQPSGPVQRVGVLMTIAEGDAEVQPHVIVFQKALQNLEIDTST